MSGRFNHPIPEEGQTIVFAKSPVGSFARIGEKYEVSINGTKITLKHATGATTHDHLYAYRVARWEVVDEQGA